MEALTWGGSEGGRGRARAREQASYTLSPLDTPLQASLSPGRAQAARHLKRPAMAASGSWEMAEELCFAEANFRCRRVPMEEGRARARSRARTPLLRRALAMRSVERAS